MKFLQYSLLVAVTATTLTSCLKNRSEQGGLLEDKGSIVTSISEKQYINSDAQNIGAGYTNAVANFNFTKRPNESVKFFTLSVSQPREKKITGSMTVHITASDLLPTDPTGLLDTPLPAGAINVTDVVIPAQDAPLITVPVFYTVNKTLLNPANYYGVKFRAVSASQGAVSVLDSSIDVTLNASYMSFNTNQSDYEANYNYSNDVIDPVNQYVIHQRTAKRYLVEVSPNNLKYEDSYFFALTGGASSPNLVVNNTTTGATTSLFRPRFVLNAAGQVTSVVNDNASAIVTNLALDPTGLNKFTYTSNTVRTLNVKYTFTLTTTINSVVTPRTVRVSEDLTYDPLQVIF